MTNKSTLCLLFRDETVDMAFIERTVLGAQIKFMERLPRDEALNEAVAERLRTVEKTPARVLLCIPRDLAMQRTLRYPAMSPADVAGMIQYEATRHVPLPENERALGWSSVPSPDEKQVVVNLLAARESEIRSMVAAFGAVGVPIDEVVPFSSVMAPVLAGKPTLLVVSDTRKIELCLYGQGQLQESLVLAKNTPGFAPDRVVAAARQMAAKNREWLGMEGVGRILLSGPHPLEADLETAFGLRVQPLEAPAEFAGVEEPLADVLLAAVAVRAPELNLIENTGRKVPISKRTIMLASLCAILSIELVSWFAFKTGAPALQRRQVAEEIAKVRRRAAPVRRMKDKNRDMRKQLYRLDEICNRHVSVMQIWKELSELLPEDSYLQLAYYKTGDSLHIRGLSKEPDRLPERLLASPFIEAISKSDIGKKEGDYHSFAITVTLRSSDEETEI
jgi:hypothetical protein